MTTASADRHDDDWVFEECGDVVLHRHRISCGNDNSSWFARRKPGIRRIRNEVEIDARADDQRYRAALDHGVRDSGVGVLQVRAIERRRPCLDP